MTSDYPNSFDMYFPVLMKKIAAISHNFLESHRENVMACCSAFVHVANDSEQNLYTDAVALDMADVAASSGSACTTGALEPSHVLTAMGIDSDLAHASLRLTLGTSNTTADIDRVLAVLPEIVARLRSLAGSA